MGIHSSAKISAMGIIVLPICTLATIMCSAAKKAPTLFVFGDSLVDVGNNNYINTVVKANHCPNGIDYFRRPTGRFTNGRTAVDIIEQEFGSKNFTPPYLAPATTSRMLLDGVNYASAGSGIQNETGRGFGGHIPFQTQVDYHAEARQQIISQIGVSRAKDLFRNAVYIIITGSNDLLYEERSRTQRRHVTEDAYLDNTMLIVQAQLTRLYDMEARKMIVGNVGPIGCIPYAKDIWPNNQGNACVGRLNSRARAYNSKLKSLVLVDLARQMKQATLFYADIYAVLEDILQNSKAYGFKYADRACCAVAGSHGGLIPCNPISRLCRNRSEYVFWDPYHLTDAANAVAGKHLLYGGSNFISPTNISCLISMP